MKQQDTSKNEAVNQEGQNITTNSPIIKRGLLAIDFDQTVTGTYMHCHNEIIAMIDHKYMQYFLDSTGMREAIYSFGESCERVRKEKELITALSKRNALNDEIDTLSGQKEELSEQKKELSQQLKDVVDTDNIKLKEQLETIEEQLETIEEQLKTIEGKLETIIEKSDAADAECEPLQEDSNRLKEEMHDDKLVEAFLDHWTKKSPTMKEQIDYFKKTLLPKIYKLKSSSQDDSQKFFMLANAIFKDWVKDLKCGVDDLDHLDDNVFETLLSTIRGSLDKAKQEAVNKYFKENVSLSRLDKMAVTSAAKLSQDKGFFMNPEKLAELMELSKAADYDACIVTKNLFPEAVKFLLFSLGHNNLASKVNYCPLGVDPETIKRLDQVKHCAKVDDYGLISLKDIILLDDKITDVESACKEGYKAFTPFYELGNNTPQQTPYYNIIEYLKQFAQEKWTKIAVTLDLQVMQNKDINSSSIFRDFLTKAKAAGKIVQVDLSKVTNIEAELFQYSQFLEQYWAEYGKNLELKFDQSVLKNKFEECFSKFADNVVDSGAESSTKISEKGTKGKDTGKQQKLGYVNTLISKLDQDGVTMDPQILKLLASATKSTLLIRQGANTNITDQTGLSFFKAPDHDDHDDVVDIAGNSEGTSDCVLG